MHRPLRLIFVGIAMLSACADQPSDSPVVTSASTGGDTVLVRSSGDGRWGPAHDAVVVLTLNGETPETTFGLIRNVSAAPDGGAFVYDTRGREGPIVRRFSPEGRFVRNYGRSGSGPGEYTGESMRMVVMLDGSVVGIDMQRRVSRYAENGNLLGGFQQPFGGGFAGLVAGADGTILLPATLGSGAWPDSMHAPFLRYDTLGAVVDSIVPRGTWVAAAERAAALSAHNTHGLREQWTVLPDGRGLFWRSDKVGFLISDPDGSSPPQLVEHATQPISYLDDERKELLDAQRRGERRLVEGPGGHGPERVFAEAPTTKPASRGFAIAVDGRVWVRRSAVGVKGEPRCIAAVDGHCVASVSYDEPPIYAAFEADGTYLGDVRFPLGTTHLAFVGDYAWGVTRDSDGTPILTRFRCTSR